MLNKQVQKSKVYVYILCYILFLKRGGKEGSKNIYSYLLIFIKKHCKEEIGIKKAGL